MKVRPLVLAGVRTVAGRGLPGAGALARWLYPPDRREADRIRAVVPYEGSMIQVDTGSFIEWAIYVYGGYELASVRLLRRLTHPGAVCIDAGANVGTFTLPLARAAGPSGSVLAFEPHPEIRQRLIENIALNNLRNVIVHDVALSSAAGPATLFASTTYNRGASSLAPSPDARRPIPCTVERLDDRPEVEALDRLHLVKVDTEGSDLAVLVGGTETLKRFRPCVFVEANVLGLANFGVTPADLLSFLLGLGYRVWRNDVGEFEASPRLSMLRDLSDLPPGGEMGRGLGWENWLAVHAGWTGTGAGDAATP